MTHQIDMMPGAMADAITDPAALERAAEQLPKAREVQSRIPFHLTRECKEGLRSIMSPRAIADLQQRIVEIEARADLGHELVLPERAREDHR